jgi:hypothetical protein
VEPKAIRDFLFNPYVTKVTAHRRIKIATVEIKKKLEPVLILGIAKK